MNMLFGLFCKRLVSNHTSIGNGLLGSKSEVGVFPFNSFTISTIRFFSSSSSSLKPEGDKQSFTTSYLINSCGLSPAAAKSVSKFVLFDNPKKPDSVLSLLKHHGFTDTHISKVVSKQPHLLVSNVNKTILPKLQFLLSVGFSNDDLHQLISKNPHLLSRSLEQFLIPAYDVLKTLLLSDFKIIQALKRMYSRHYNLNKLNVNLSALRELGMPQSTISAFISRWPAVFSMDVDKFNEAVKEVVEMGFDPVQYKFASALTAKLQLSKETWKCKIDAFQKWGLSEDEILSAFKKFPIFMILSEESIRNKMDFLVNKMGWQSAVVLKDPTVISYSLEKRIVPRCSVIRVLLLKGLINCKTRIFLILQQSDELFLERYVMKHKEQVPELLDVYEGKMDLEVLGFGFNEEHTASRV